MATTSADPPVALPVEVPDPPKRSLLRDVRTELRSVVHYRHLLRYLVSSSLRTENSNTVFGFVWWILDPLLLAAIYVILVGVILGRGSPDFPVFVLTAMISWELFSKATNDAASETARKERSMRQIAFPKSVLPLATVLAAAVHFLAGFVVLLIVAIPFGIYPSILALLALPIALVQLAFTLGVAYFLSALNVFFRDTNKLTSYLFRMWFFLSPGLYSVSMVPERFRDLYELNPFSTFFTAYRSVVMYHDVPDLAALGILAGASLVVLILGYAFFVRLQPWFVKLI